MVLSSLAEKNRQKRMDAGAEDCPEKSALTLARGVNLLPETLENLICRINRRRGIAFSSVAVWK